MVLTLAFALSRSLSAQEDTPLRPDARIRVWSAQFGYERHEGVVTARSNDTLWLRSLSMDLRAAESTTVSLPYSAIDSLEVRTRTSRVGVRRSALRGALIGGAAASVLGFSSCNDSGYSPCEDPAMAILIFGLGAGAGAVVGGLAGVVRGASGWQWVGVALR